LDTANRYCVLCAFGSDYSVWFLLDRCADAILLGVSSHGP
jgi:hypothetical protein